MSLSDKFLLDQYDTNISQAQFSNVTELEVFNSASDDVKVLLARRNPAYGNYYNIPPPLLPYRVSGGAEFQVPEFPPTDEMSRVHSVITGARVNNLVTPNFLDTLGPIAEDEAAFIPPDPLEDKIFIDSSTYDVNSTRKVVTMIAYEFSDKPYFFGTVGEISVANIAGGLAITVIGDHFQPSGFAVARFTDVQSWFAFYSSLRYINKTHAMFYTPRIPTAAATHLQISNNGFIFTSPLGSGLVEGSDEGFGFYEVSSRRPLSGSALGRTGVILRGAFLQRMVKAKAICMFGPCDIQDVQSPTEWSEELQTAVCFSPPISKQCSELYIATAFRILVGYELVIQDIWFYVEITGPSIFQAQFDPSLRSIAVYFRDSTNLGSYNRSESCERLFTIPSLRFILSSTVAYWPEPFTLILLLDQAHKLRFNSILEFSNGGDITDASDKSLTLAGAVKFTAPPFIATPIPVLTCPLHALAISDIFVSAQHSYGLSLHNVSVSWNVSVSADDGYSESLMFTIVQENVIRISAANISAIAFWSLWQNRSIEVHTQFTVFFNGSNGQYSPGISNLSSNSSLRDPSIKDSPECSKIKTVQDAVRSNARMCIVWQQVSSKCISKVTSPLTDSVPKIHIDRPFNSSFSIPSDSDAYFRTVVTNPIQDFGNLFIRWKVTSKKSALIYPQLQFFCENESTDSIPNPRSSVSSDICDLNEFVKRNNADLALSGPILILPRNALPPGFYDLSASLFLLSNCSWSDEISGESASGESSSFDISARRYSCQERVVHSDTVRLRIFSVHTSPITYINGAVSSGSPFYVDAGALVCIQFDNISSCQITQPTAFSESDDPKDSDFEEIQRSFKETISKSRQFLTLDAVDLVLLNSSEFSRLFCSRCNGQISKDITSYVNRVFGNPSGNIEAVDPDPSEIDNTGLRFELIPTSNVSYTLEQVCFERLYLNTTHFTKMCNMFLNATRTNIKKYLNISDPQGFTLQHNVLSVKSIYICQYNHAFFNVLLKDPSVYATRLSPLYTLQWSCVIRPSKEPSSGYNSRNAFDAPCLNFSSSSFHAAAIFYDQINTSMVVRISCRVLSSHILGFLPVEAVVVLYPYPRNSVPTPQRIPVNPSLSVLDSQNVPIRRAHVLRHSNSSSPYLTLISTSNYDFSFVSDVRWESRVSWLKNLSNILLDSLANSNSFILDSQLSIPSSLISLGFNYVFRVSHFFRGQQSGFSEVVVNMSSPFFHGEATVMQLPSGFYRISTHKIEVNDEERPLQFSFLQSLDFNLTLQPMGFSQTYSGPIYNASDSNSVASVFILTQSASLSTVCTNVSVSLYSASILQDYSVESILNGHRQSTVDFFVSSHMILQLYNTLSFKTDLLPHLTITGLSRDSPIQTVGDLFERKFLEPLVQLLCSQLLLSQQDLQLFIPKEVDFKTILESNSTAETLKIGVPSSQGAEHISAVLFEGLQILSKRNDSIPSIELCRRIIVVVSRLVELDFPFSVTTSSSLFGILARCIDSEVADLLKLMDKVSKFGDDPGNPVFDGNTTFPSPTLLSGSPGSTSTSDSPDSTSSSASSGSRTALSPTSNSTSLTSDLQSSNGVLTAGVIRSPNQRQLLQQLSLQDLQNQVSSSAAVVVNNAMSDFSAICDRMRETASISGAPLTFSYSGTVVHARNFFTGTGVSMETSQFTFKKISCSSVAVNVQSVIPADPSFNFHRSSICIGVTARDLTPSSKTVGGASGFTKIRTKFVPTFSSFL
jgi:hypothetical protein